MNEFKVVSSAAENLRSSNRRILVTGPRASGKTAFSVSASRHAGETVKQEKRVECKDVLLIQGDNEGLMGAMDCGLVPGYVLDMCSAPDWKVYRERLVAGLKELDALLRDGTIRVCIVDLGLAARLIDRYVDPAAQKDWKLVAIEGAKLFHFLSGLRGVTVIGNAQIKAAVSPGESMVSADAATAKAIGGERSTFTIDLPKGVASHWLDNCSFVFAREAKRVKGNDGALKRTYRTHTQSTGKFEAKSRAEGLLSPTEPGDKSLNSLLQRAYGEDY